MSKKDTDKEISDLLQIFNRQISRVFKIIDKIVPNDKNMELAKIVIRRLRFENPPAVLDKCVDKIWDHKDQIMNKDVEFFLNCSFDKYVKVDKRKNWLDTIIATIRIKYFELSEKEQKYVWDCMNQMLECVIKYRILIGYHK